MTRDTLPGEGTVRPAVPFTERTPRVVAAGKLHRSSARRRSGRFLAEGTNTVEAAITTGVAVELFCTASAMERFGAVVDAAAAASVTISLVTDRAARSLADTVTPTGIMALCRSVVRDATAPETGPEVGGDPDAAPRLVAVGQGLAEPGNVGTLIRVADALGADEVWLTEGSVDPESPKAVRASAGSLFYVPVIRGVVESDLLERAHRNGLQLVVATGGGELSVEEADDALAAPTAWVFGNEAHGVSATLAEVADLRVRIPIRGRAESLNIVTAASICMHTSARLRPTAT